MLKPVRINMAARGIPFLLSPLFDQPRRHIIARFDSGNRMKVVEGGNY